MDCLMHSNNYNSLIKIASPVVPSTVKTQDNNMAIEGTRVPSPQIYADKDFVGGPSTHIVNKLHSYGLPMTPASSGINPQRLSEAETQLKRIQSAEAQNQIGKEKNWQNLDAHFARLTALNDANKAAGRPTYSTTWQDLYAPYANMSSPIESKQAYGRAWKDSVLSSTAAYADKVKGTPYNPAELRSLSNSVPADTWFRDRRKDDALDHNLNTRNRWIYGTFGLNSLKPRFNSMQANYGRKVPAWSLSDFSEKPRNSSESSKKPWYIVD